jgi:hypothetical protein
MDPANQWCLQGDTESFKLIQVLVFWSWLIKQEKEGLETGINWNGN